MPQFAQQNVGGLTASVVFGDKEPEFPRVVGVGDVHGPQVVFPAESESPPPLNQDPFRPQVGWEGQLSPLDRAARVPDIEDLEVFPGLDQNNDFISDFNQNQNELPDYAEPFLRYAVDPPEFLFGMDMNNNTIIDRFEDDQEPDYPYDRDLRGANLYAGLMLGGNTQLTAGRLRERRLSSARRSRVDYALVTSRWDGTT